MKILYIGEIKSGTTSFHRKEALERLGHSCQALDPSDAVKRSLSNRLTAKIHYRTGFRFLAGKVERWMGRELARVPEKPEMVWINSGQFLSPRTMRVLKSLKIPLVLYNNDDPTGGRDQGCWHLLLKSLPYYDLCVSLRTPTVKDMVVRGAPRSYRVWMSYDENLHVPPAEDEKIDEIFQSDVVFVGTWMRHENRHVFLRELLDAGIRVKIWGNRWNKCDDRELIAKCWTGKAASGRDYVHAIAGAKICLGLLSKGNRDLHTRRSVEIPYCGGLLCAERTKEHLELYKEGEEAVFWDTASECIQVCRWLLADDATREAIRKGGMRRIRELGLGNEDVVRGIIRAATDPSWAHAASMQLPLHS
jgi:spore maturation protein CgeB